MKKRNLIFNSLYEQALSNSNEYYDELDEQDDEVAEQEEEQPQKRSHDICKDIQGIKMLLADLEAHYEISEEDCNMSHIDHDELHDYIVDKLNSGCCDRYTCHHINDHILTHPHFSPEHVFHSLWYNC